MPGWWMIVLLGLVLLAITVLGVHLAAKQLERNEPAQPTEEPDPDEPEPRPRAQ